MDKGDGDGVRIGHAHPPGQDPEREASGVTEETQVLVYGQLKAADALVFPNYGCILSASNLTGSLPLRAIPGCSLGTCSPSTVWTAPRKALHHRKASP